MRRSASFEDRAAPMSVFAWIGLVIFLALASPHSRAEVLSGSATAIDGDTIVIGERIIRLHGIDAPETGQRCTDARGRPWSCGTEARDLVRRLLQVGPLTCRGQEIDRYGRLIARCVRSDGVEINDAMVRAGHAWAFIQYSTDYVAVEHEARAAKRGIWRGESEPPWTFRERRWAVSHQEAPKRGDVVCPIKGNITKSGQKIYHAPWHRDYPRVRINEKQGERWFCDEGEAVKAGWRLPRGAG